MQACGSTQACWGPPTCIVPGRDEPVGELPEADLHGVHMPPTPTNLYTPIPPTHTVPEKCRFWVLPLVSCSRARRSSGCTSPASSTMEKSYSLHAQC